MSQNSKNILGGGIGNMIEWYDFILYSYFATLLAQNFFPKENEIAAVMLTFATFASGYLVRPLGAIILGKLGDNYGRAFALKVSMFGITLAMFLMSILPSFHSIGLLAPILLVLLRLLQGICIGGEHAGGIIYLGEIANPENRALIVSMKNNAANIGMLISMGMASLLFTFFSAAQMHSYGWRLGYIIGAAIGMIFLFLRNKITEPALYLNYKNQLSLVTMLQQLKALSLQPIILVITMTSMGAVLLYITFIYLPSYLKLTQVMPIAVSLRLVTFVTILS
ncbi:MAG: MFS transporter, partial [Pseudomonadota bacterium]